MLSWRTQLYTKCSVGDPMVLTLLYITHMEVIPLKYMSILNNPITITTVPMSPKNIFVVKIEYLVQIQPQQWCHSIPWPWKCGKWHQDQRGVMDDNTFLVKLKQYLCCYLGYHGDTILKIHIFTPECLCQKLKHKKTYKN